MRADLDLIIVDGRGGDGATALEDGLFEKCAFGVGESLVMPDRDNIGFRNRHSGVAPNPLVGAKEQVEFLFQRDRKRIDLDRRPVGPAGRRDWGR